MLMKLPPCDSQKGKACGHAKPSEHQGEGDTPDP